MSDPFSAPPISSPNTSSAIPLAATFARAISSTAWHDVALTVRSDTPPQAGALHVSGPMNHDVVATLQASDPEGDPLTLRIASLPTAGTLYQYSGGFRGALVSATNTAVTDPLGRVIFAPTPGASGIPYATFNYVATDGIFDSTPATVTVDIIGPSPFAFTRSF